VNTDPAAAERHTLQFEPKPKFSIGCELPDVRMAQVPRFRFPGCTQVSFLVTKSYRFEIGCNMHTQDAQRDHIVLSSADELALSAR
jgi:hypothetical protein